MTVTSVGRIAPLRTLLAFLLVSGAPGLASAAGESAVGSTFNAPGYSTPAPASQLGRPAVPAGVAEPVSADGKAAAPATNKAPSSTDAAPARPVTALSRSSEFQRFVEAATGQLLPVFGADFFSDAADAAARLDNIPVSADYTVGPGDEIVIRAWGSIDVDYRSTVDRNGLINLPRIGSFNVAGVKAADLERHLSTQIGRLYTNFSLSVSLGQLRSVRVFVVGPAQRSGVYTLPSQATMLSAIVAAGGPALNGSMRRVLLRRNGIVMSELDVYQFLNQGDNSKDVQLVAGDVIVFQPVGARVALNGAIDTQAIYELKQPQEPVRDLLRYAGGLPVLTSPSRALLERIDSSQPKASRFVEDFQLDANGLQRPLRDGDVLTLLAISPEFANAVTLQGHVAAPLRYVFRPGMRISDLIPNADALISADFYRRKNLLVQVLPNNRDGESEALAARAKKNPTALFEEVNWDFAVIERLNVVDLTTQVIPFNLGRAVLQRDPAHDLELMVGDVVTVYSQRDLRVPVARQTRLVSIEGEVAVPGFYQLLPGETLRGLIGRAGGFTTLAYVYGLELSREETRQRQAENLAAAVTRLEALASVQLSREAAMRRNEEAINVAGLSGSVATQTQLARLRSLKPNGRIALELTPQSSSVDSLPDLPLDNADRITVPLRPGFVTVVGAVANNNAYVWKPGRTAGDYLRLAGTDEAADLSNMFILRADGTVTHGSNHRSFFGSGLQSQSLEAGDALIVPNQLDFETWGRALVRNLKDFAQIFSQFGLGAAAIKTLGN